MLPDPVAGKPATVDGVEFALAPGITVNLSLAVGPVLDAQVRSLTGYGMTATQARDSLVTGSPAQVAERLAAMPFTPDRGEQIELLGEVAGLLR
ncbi:hypothetical protein [Amycolatopsis sp. 195334CR]|uniref:hypothetical protein n=1 Tax=Amycolatopsis sp. 195334CR TaxID=2814588 RepID=UPI001A8F2CF1|nr:hypothetical protein [Amycolatopsis sp. 195334CR]MBN6034455.1 hypothetical protein [Amycolatopsis sp. 195334CR]